MPRVAVLLPARDAAPTVRAAPRGAPVIRLLREHWSFYVIEGGALGLFMVSATVFSSLFEHPAFPLRAAIADPFARRALVGLLMGLTAIALIYSPPGRRSGAHMNPAVTLTFLRLGKIAPADAAFYVAAQFAGGLAGCLAGGSLVYPVAGREAFRIVATVPGPAGSGVAFAAEALISFVLMLTVLCCSNSRRLAPYTGLFAGGLVALFISVEAPLSGMSMNIARTVASAFPAGEWRGIGIYATAPLLGMLGAAELYRRVSVWGAPLCAKLQHGPRCIFRCNYDRLTAPVGGGGSHD